MGKFLRREIRRVSSRDQTAFGDTHASPRIARRDSESQSAIRITSLQQLIVRSPCRDCARRKLQRLTSIVLEAITSFLCGRHFLHLFSSREVRPQHARGPWICRSYARRNNVVRSLSQAFRSPTETTDAPRDGSHGCLTRHHIAPSLRKSAACTSSHGPVWLFFLRCG